MFGNLYAVNTIHLTSSTTWAGIQYANINASSSTTNSIWLMWGGTHHWSRPAMDVDENERVTICFAVSSLTKFLSSEYVIIEPEAIVFLDGGVLQAGTDIYTVGSAPYRWGAYSGCARDPVDDRTMWIFGAHASNSPAGTWDTRVGAVSSFAMSSLILSPASTQSANGYPGSYFPEFFNYELANAGNCTLNWQLSNLPFWLTPGTSSGQIPPGSSQQVLLFINYDANLLPVGTHSAFPFFNNCTGPGSNDGQIDLTVDQTSGIGDPPRPLANYLRTPAPSPAAGVVSIGYGLKEAGTVSLAVYDVKGRRVAKLLSREPETARNASLEFDTRPLPSGVYFVKMETQTGTMTRKFIVAH